MLAIDRVTNEKVAIKFLGCLNTADNHAKVLREVKVLEKLVDQTIIKMKNAFILDTNLVIIMEFASGGELKEYVNKKGRISEDEARLIFKQIAEAMHHCHIFGVVHRDLKMENVLFSNKEYKQVKVQTY